MMRQTSPSRSEQGEAPEGRLAGLTIEQLWALLPIAFLAIASFGNPLRLLDFWWHLKAGQVIVETLSIPSVDSFSYTAGGEHYALQNWLSEVIYYLAYWVGGFPLLRTLNTLCLTATLAIILHLCLQSSRNIRWAAAASALALLPLIIYSSVRPQVFSFLFFALFYWVLDGYRRQARNRLWMLPLLMILWVNMHGAFVLGLGLFGLYLAAESIDWLNQVRSLDTSSKRSPRSAMTKLRRLAAFFVLTMGATLANPEVHGVYTYVLTVLEDPSSRTFVTEWQAPQINDLAGVLCFFLPFFVAIVIFFYSKGLELLELGIFLCFAVLALTALRNGIWFALIVPPIAARQLLCIFPRTERPESDGRALGGRVARRLNLLFAALIMLITGIVSPWVYPTVSGIPHWDPETPVGAIDFIESKKLPGRIFHPQTYGDYLIWRLWPDQKTFVDGRVHLFGKQIVEDYFEVFVDPNWEERLRAYDIRYLLLSRKDSRCQRLIPKVEASERWYVRYEDHLSILFEREPLRP